jgi:hypothetical protein
VQVSLGQAAAVAAVLVVQGPVTVTVEQDASPLSTGQQHTMQVVEQVTLVQAALAAVEQTAGTVLLLTTARKTLVVAVQASLVLGVEQVTVVQVSLSLGSPSLEQHLSWLTLSVAAVGLLVTLLLPVARVTVRAVAVLQVEQLRHTVAMTV